MATNFGLKMSKVVIKLANGDAEIDGVSVPCHHAGFDRGNPLYDVGHSKKTTLASRVELPIYNQDGTETGVESKVKTGMRFKIVSRQRKSLSHNVRVCEPITFDEGAVAFHVTDTRR